MLASFMVAAEPRYVCSRAVAPGEVVPLSSLRQRSRSTAGACQRPVKNRRFGAVTAETSDWKLRLSRAGSSTGDPARDSGLEIAGPYPQLDYNPLNKRAVRDAMPAFLICCAQRNIRLSGCHSGISYPSLHGR